MNLKEYLENEGLTPKTFAPKIGVTDKAVRYWLRGQGVPNKTTMGRIVKETNGKVSPASFFDVRILGKVS